MTSANILITIKPLSSYDTCHELVQQLSPIGCKLHNGCEDIRYFYTDMAMYVTSPTQAIPTIIEILHAENAPLETSVFNCETGQDQLVYPVEDVIAYCQKMIVELPQGKLSKPEQDSHLGLIYYSLAQAYIEKNDTGNAIKAWQTSFAYAPFIQERNNKALVYLLENEAFEEAEPFVKMLFSQDLEDQGNHNAWYRNKLIKVIAPLALTDKLNDAPHIMAYYLHILHMRDKKNPKHIAPALALTKQHPDCSEAWKLLGDVYYEGGDFEKAAEAFLHYLKGDNPILDNYVGYMVKAFLKAGHKLKNIDFGTEGTAQGLYNAAAQIDCSLTDKQARKKAKQLRNIQVPLYAKSFALFHDYYVEHTGSPINSGHHTFAMCCNNYANSMTEVLPANPNKKQKKIYRKAYYMHLLGYKTSPFYENIRAAATDAHYAQDWDQAIEFCQTFFKDYEGQEEAVGTDNFQDSYNTIVHAYWKKKDYPSMLAYYNKAAALYKATEDTDFDEDDDFLKTASYCTDELINLEKFSEEEKFLKDMQEIADWKDLKERMKEADYDDEMSVDGSVLLDELTAEKSRFLPIIGFVITAGLIYLLSRAWVAFM